MSDEKMIRAFLAIDPPEEILAAIGRIQGRLQRMIRGELRWVRPEAIHLTLKFFGDIPEDAVADIAAVVEKAAAADAAVHLRDRRGGGLPRSAPAPGPLARDGGRCAAAPQLPAGARSRTRDGRFPGGGAALPAPPDAGADQVLREG